MDNTFGFIAGVIIFFLFFLLIRELIVWYWKINEILSVLKKIEENTRPIEDKINGTSELRSTTEEKDIKQDVLIKEKNKTVESKNILENFAQWFNS